MKANPAAEDERRPLPMKMSPADVPAYQATERPPGYDGEPPLHAERRTLVWEDGKRIAGVSPENINHSRINWLFAHGRIDKRQKEAAERLERDWEMSQIQPRASSVMVGNGSSSSDNHPNDAKVDAMRRHGDAMDALGAAWPMVELVVQGYLSVEKASAQLRFHTKYGHGVLWVGLHMLADFYKLPRDTA